MMAWTDHHFRQLLRMLTRRTLLYTEMYPVDVVLEAAAAPRDGPMRHETAAPRGKPSGEWKPSTLAERTHTALRQLLAFDPEQHPIAVQLGGRHAQRMGEAVNLTLTLTLALALALALALTLTLTLTLALLLTLILTLTPHCAAQPRARHATTPAYGAARSAHPPQQALTAPPTLARAHRRR